MALGGVAVSYERGTPVHHKPHTLNQVLVPVLGQTIQVPFHLMALSLYNKPELDVGKRLKVFCSMLHTYM